MGYERADAILIRHADYSETSRIYTFFTREFGRFSALAKGARRRYSKLTGHLDLLAHAEIVFLSGRTRERLRILTEADAADTFSLVRRDLPRFYAACHAAELVQSMTADEDPNPQLFDRLLGLLHRLEAGVGPALALFSFEVQLLVLCGFMPELERCVACGNAAAGATVAFSPRRGGVLCGACVPAEADAAESVPRGGVALLARLARGRVTRLHRVRLSAAVAKQARAFLNAYESCVLGRELRTVRHL